MVKRSIIVTGALGGIGKSIAEAFAAAGDDLLLVDLVEDSGQSFSQSLRSRGAGTAVSVAADITDEAAVAKAVDLAIATFGRWDVMVNVAGAMIYKDIVDLTAADWRRLMDINLIGAAMFTGHALRRMEPGGCVVNVASVHARRTTPLVAPYAAAKAALVSLTRSAAIEGKPRGIRVNAVCPGAIDTELLRASPAIRSGAEVLDPADVGKPEDVASLVRYLASDEARFMTGEDVVCDGGRMGRL